MSTSAPSPGSATGPMGCSEAQAILAVLDLGADDPVGRERAEAHASSCEVCPSVLAALAATVEVLRRLEGEGMDPLPPTPDVLERVLARLRAERSAVEARRNRRAAVTVVAGLAAAAALVLVAVLVPAHEDGGAVLAAPVTVSATDPATSVSASVTVTSTGTGADMRLTVNGVDPGAECAIVVVGRDGTSEVAARWMAGYVGTAEVSAATEIPAGDIVRVDVTSPTDGTLVSLQIAA